MVTSHITCVKFNMLAGYEDVLYKLETEMEFVVMGKMVGDTYLSSMLVLDVVQTHLLPCRSIQ